MICDMLGSSIFNSVNILLLVAGELPSFSDQGEKVGFSEFIEILLISFLITITLIALNGNL